MSPNIAGKASAVTGLRPGALMNSQGDLAAAGDRAYIFVVDDLNARDDGAPYRDQGREDRAELRRDGKLLPHDLLGPAGEAAAALVEGRRTIFGSPRIPFVRTKSLFAPRRDLREGTGE